MNLTKLFEAVLPPDAKTLLDIGCGICNVLREFPVPVRVGVDVWRPYLTWVRNNVPRDIVLVNADASEVRDLFLDDSFDVVSLIDVVEHFPKAKGYKLLKDAEAVAIEQVLVFAPRGKNPQRDDAWNMGGEKYQRHRSEWQPKDFKKLGYKVLALEKFHVQKDLDAIVAYKDLS